MKKSYIVAFISSVFLMILASTTFADVIPENSHPLDLCVKIVNGEAFPDMYLIGYITGPMVQDHEAYIIQKDACLTMGYKFNTLQIVTAKKSYIDSIGIINLRAISVELADKNIFVSDEKISPYGGYVEQTNPLIKEQIEYTITGFSDGKLRMYKSKQISEYNDGTATKTEVFTPPMRDFFTDVSPTHKNYEAIKYVYEQGIVQGYSDNTYRPDASINRSEFTKILIKSRFEATEIENCISLNIPLNQTFVYFSDVSRSFWSAKYICVAGKRAIVGGYPDGEYKPENFINFVEAAKIILWTFDYQISSDPIWYKPYVDTLAEKQAIPDSITQIDQNITRGEMAEIIWRLKAHITILPSKSYDDLIK